MTSHVITPKLLDSTVNPIVVLIPAFNEERFIGSVVLKAREHAGSIVVVDDGSSDETAAIAQAAGAIVLSHPQNQGKGAAMRTGMRYIRELCPAVVVTFDADGQHFAEEIGLVAQPILDGRADIVVGSRYLTTKNLVPRHRVWGHRLFNLFTNRLSGIALSDTQSGFRAIAGELVQHLSFTATGFAVESEMQFMAHERRLRVLEVPVTIQYRDKPKRPVAAHGLVVLNGILRLIGQYRPLLFFGVPGLCVALAGVGLGIFVLENYQRSEPLMIGLALTSVVMILVGMMALFTGIMLHSVRALLLDFVARSPVR